MIKLFLNPVFQRSDSGPGSGVSVPTWHEITSNAYAAAVGSSNNGHTGTRVLCDDNKKSVTANRTNLPTLRQAVK